MIFYVISKGLNQQQCIEPPRRIFDNEASSQKTVYNWFAIPHGRASVSGKFLIRLIVASSGPT